MESSSITPTKKLCRVCEQVLEINPKNFSKGKAVCRPCYNKQYNNKYKQRKEAEKESKLNEIKSSAVEEFSQLAEKNKLLESKIKSMENTVSTTRAKIIEIAESLQTLLKPNDELKS